MARLQPITPVQINEQVYGAIESAIIQCELAPGVALSDRQLAGTFGVSRAPVRDALHRLEASGLVQRRGRAGWAVAKFDRRDVEELFELRRVLEPLGLKRLSLNWNEKDVRELSSFFEEFPDQIPSDLVPDYLRCDYSFHRRIVECSQNRRIVHFYGVVEKQISRIRHYLYSSERRVNISIGEHRRICEGIAGRDLEAATTALLYNLKMAEETMITMLRERQLGHLDNGEST